MYDDDFSSYEDAETQPYPTQDGYEDDDNQVTSTSFGLFLPLIAVLMVAGFLIGMVYAFILPNMHLSTSSVASDMPEPSPEDQNSKPTNGIATFFAPTVKHWEPQILEWAATWNIDPNLIATIIQIESCGDPKAISSSGAMGLFQVMPFHFSAGEDTFDPQVNAQRGIDYLQQAFQARQGDIRKTFASYNGGINGASQPETNWTDEMLRYAEWGSGIYSEAQSGSTTSPTLERWMAAGGTSLCAQATQELELIPQVSASVKKGVY